MDEEHIDEQEFLSNLCKRTGDTEYLQSTPLKRAARLSASTGITAYNGESHNTLFIYNRDSYFMMRNYLRG